MSFGVSRSAAGEGLESVEGWAKSSTLSQQPLVSEERPGPHGFSRLRNSPEETPKRFGGEGGEVS